MKKVYCFHCQQDITPYKVWKWNICPRCFRPTPDDGSGLYLVCDNCGANMPSDAKYCPKCGYSPFGLPPRLLSASDHLNGRNVLQQIIRFGALFLSLLLSVGVLYLSFYLLFVFALVGLAYYLFTVFKH